MKVSLKKLRIYLLSITLIMSSTHALTAFSQVQENNSGVSKDIIESFEGEGQVDTEEAFQQIKDAGIGEEEIQALVSKFGEKKIKSMDDMEVELLKKGIILKELNPYIKVGLFMAIGTLAEIIFTGSQSLYARDWTLEGYTQLWVLPLYVLAGFGLSPISKFLENVNPILRATLYSAGAMGLEYFGGFVAEKITGRCPWEYSGPYNIHGKINLFPHPFAWAFLTMVGESVVKYFNKLKVPTKIDLKKLTAENQSKQKKKKK